MKQTITIIIALLLGAARAAAEGRIVDLSQATATDVANGIVLQDGDVLTGRLDVANCPIKIIIDYFTGSDPTRVTLRDVTIEGVDNSSYEWAGITCEGSATITLEGENIVRGFYENYPGIYVPAGHPLTIGGDDGTATGIEAVQATSLRSGLDGDAWHDLQGRRLSEKPARKGLYIRNGKKIVIK